MPVQIVHRDRDSGFLFSAKHRARECGQDITTRYGHANHHAMLEEMGVLLSGSALSKSFSARPLFEDLSLSLSDGDRTGLIGPNGSGKTT